MPYGLTRNSAHGRTVMVLEVGARTEKGIAKRTPTRLGVSEAEKRGFQSGLNRNRQADRATGAARPQTRTLLRIYHGGHRGKWSGLRLWESPLLAQKAREKWGTRR